MSFFASYNWFVLLIGDLGSEIEILGNLKGRRKSNKIYVSLYTTRFHYLQEKTKKNVTVYLKDKRFQNSDSCESMQTGTVFI